MRHDIVHLHPQAPLPPPHGEACNGCGVCCSLEPCPLGMLLSGALSGPCRMLRWRPDRSRYECGALRWSQHLPGPASGPVTACVSRWIAAGQGCDASLQVVDPRGDART
ncbi:MAG TPA: hypothetical protein PLF63_02050 [Rubrivivax sp.]|nr:hypothetical protein [Rubrivivax sp.]